MITWIVGAGGLLGNALSRHAGETHSPGPVNWTDATQAAGVLHQQARAFEQVVGNRPWRVIWAAGAATTSTPKALAEAEQIPLEGLLTGLRSALPSGPGSFFLSSSAGGVYAGSSDPPFTIDTPPAPLSPYGELKLAQEELAATILGPTTPVIIGRITNLYGPGQNLDKLQGLISRLALSALTRDPVNIFVPLETMRDYIYADDAARAILDAMRSHTSEEISRSGARVELIGSGRGVTIAQLIRTTNEVTKRRVPVALGSHASARAQAIDLRVIPTVSPEPIMTLPAGIRAVNDDLLTRLQRSPVHV